ncbi:MAG: hypothetical protein SFU87_19895 [Chitinophagaceae bacterium]|nr:hypothetical protein [Chitinophagaceae bacterium]
MAQGKGVWIIDNPNSSLLEIRNENFGIVIPKEKNFNLKNPKEVLAPIQSIIYRDGTYSDDTPNYLISDVPPVSVKIIFDEKTAERCIVRIRYHFNKPQFVYNKQTYKGGNAGPGYYQTTITLTKTSKSALIEEDSDYDVYYQVKISKGLNPDKARYRGAASDNAANGYEPTGIAYRQENARGAPLDATVDIKYDQFRVFPFLSLWDVSGGEYNTGRYWMLYNSRGSINGNLLGFFQGRPSKLIGSRLIGPRLIVNARNQPGSDIRGNEESHIALQIAMLRRSADNKWYPRKRAQWCLYISTMKDLLPPDKFQPIGREMNYVSGLASRIDDYAVKPAKMVPAFYDGSIYIPSKNIQVLIDKVKKNVDFYNYLLNVDPGFKFIMDAWRFPDSAQSVIKQIINYGEQVKKQIKEEDGIHSFYLKYWMGTTSFKKIAIQASCLFADKNIKISNPDREKVLAVLRMIARMVWDDDNVPFFDSAGVNFGTANMPFMYKNNGRNFFALLFAGDPEFKGRAAKILNETRADLKGAVYNNGSSFGTPHYIQPTLEPLLYTMLQLKQSGVGDLFAEQKTLLTKFVDFYTSLLVPPSVRFSGYRKLVSIGDGSEESAVVFALLAAGWENTDAVLSSKLYYVFQNGAPRASAYGSIALAADLSGKSNAGYTSSSSNYTGYLSHFRNAVNTENETALWVLNGDKYFDHRNDDRGEMMIYALKAPLSLSRSCFYYPFARSANIRSMVIPETLFPQWSGPAQPVTAEGTSGEVWQKSDQLVFAKLGNSVFSHSVIENDKTIWHRKIVMVTVRDDEPIFVFYDSLNNNAANIWSMMFMSEGPVITPAGSITPAEKIYNNNTLKQLPEATAEKKLQAGLNQFSFTGQQWSKKFHPAGGINWDFYTYTTSSSGFILAQWTNTWQNTAETNEFTATNGRPYSEAQQILRWKSTKPFMGVLLPYAKGRNPYNGKVKMIGQSQVLIDAGRGTYVVSPQHYYYKETGLAVLGSFTSLPVSADNITTSGGEAEIEIMNNRVKVRVHGNTGLRKIIFPFYLKPGKNYPGVAVKKSAKGMQVEIGYKRKSADLLSSEKGYTEYVWER